MTRIMEYQGCLLGVLTRASCRRSQEADVSMYRVCVLANSKMTSWSALAIIDLHDQLCCHISPQRIISTMLIANTNVFITKVRVNTISYITIYILYTQSLPATLSRRVTKQRDCLVIYVPLLCFESMRFRLYIFTQLVMLFSSKSVSKSIKVVCC